MNQLRNNLPRNELINEDHNEGLNQQFFYLNLQD